MWMYIFLSKPNEGPLWIETSLRLCCSIAIIKMMFSDIQQMKLKYKSPDEAGNNFEHNNKINVQNRHTLLHIAILVM